MLRTATALLVLVVFVCVSQVNAAITRTENFDVDPGWTVVGSGENGNNFGYQSSKNAGGSAGEGGGRFTRSAFVKYYADTNLGGTLTLDQPFSASGRFDYTVQSTADFGFTNMLGHFSTSGFGRVGIGVNYDGKKFYWTPIIVFDDFKHVSTSTAFTKIIPDVNRTWSYDWDPDGGAGFGSLTTILDGVTHTIDLTTEQRAKGATMDAFGFAGLAGSFGSNPSQYADIYFDDVTYSVIPEASSLIIWSVLGTLAVAATWRKRRKKVLCRSMACLVFVSLCCVGQVQASLLTNGGFETVETYGGGFPSTFGVWQGNVSHVVGAEYGITPLAGSHMLKFDYAGDLPVLAGPGRSSQLWQLVDLSPYSDWVSTGNAVIAATGYFNRVSGDSETDRHFVFTANAYQGRPDTFDWGSGTHIATSGHSKVDSDSDPNTWEATSLSLAVPSNADYVALEVAAYENIVNDLTGVEFDGHYADAITMTINGEPNVIPEPSSILIWLLMGAIGLICYGRNRRKWSG